MSDLRDDVLAQLTAAADAERAVRQRAYMRSELEFYGVPVPTVRAMVRAAAARHRLASADEFLGVVAELWDSATRREERYAAIALLRAPRNRRWALAPEVVALLRRLIVEGAWWDLVDDLSHCLGDLLRADPQAIRPVVRAWSRDGDQWLRRAAIICQLGFKEDTDRGLLIFAIAGSIDDDGFFLRKAIGWALRDLSKTDPVWVRGYVAANRDALSPLSRREALRVIDGSPR